MVDTENQYLDEYCAYVNEVLMVESVRTNSMGFLNENFSREEYHKLLKSLVDFESRLPSLMPSSRAALVKAIDQMQHDYSSVIRGKLDKRVFAKHIASASNLTKTVVESLKEIVGLLQTHDLRSRQSDKPDDTGVGDTLGNTLSDSAKEVIGARVSVGFGAPQKTSLWGRMFGTKPQKDWFGLTPEAMTNDILALDRKALLRLGIDKDLVDKYLPEGGAPAKAKPADVTEPKSFDEITPGENPDAEIDIDSLDSEERGSGDSTTSEPKKPRRSLLSLPKKTPPPQTPEPELPATDVPKKKTPAKKAPVKKGTKKEDLSREDEVIIETWRRLAGIN